jgi:tRNA-dihydrouridine synthase
VHGRTAAQSYSGHSDWRLIDRVAGSVNIPVLGSGDCIEPEQIIERMSTGVRGVLVGRGVLRNPWILAQASDLSAGRPMREVSLADRGQFLLDYIDLLLSEEEDEPTGFRHRAESPGRTRHERWVINKLRALMSWYSKGLHNGGHLRTAINSAASVDEAREIIANFFMLEPARESLQPSL